MGWRCLGKPEQKKAGSVHFDPGDTGGSFVLLPGWVGFMDQSIRADNTHPDNHVDPHPNGDDYPDALYDPDSVDHADPHRHSDADQHGDPNEDIHTDPHPYTE